MTATAQAAQNPAYRPTPLLNRKPGLRDAYSGFFYASRWALRVPLWLSSMPNHRLSAVSRKAG